MYNYLIKAGHGKYTKGKRSPYHPVLGVIEWLLDRDIAEELSTSDFESEFLNPGPIEIPLRAAKKHINAETKESSNTIAIMIHCNAAAPKGWSKASGSRIFVPKVRWKRTKAQRQAEAERVRVSHLLGEHLTFQFQNNLNIPYGVRPMKAANLSMLKVDCPAVLIECGFMTNLKDIEFLVSCEAPFILAETIDSARKAFEEEVNNE